MDSTDARGGSGGDTVFITARAPNAGFPTSPCGYLSLEAAIRDAKSLVAESGIDREVWSAFSYGGLFVGVGRMHYVPAAPGSAH